ncbi:MAG: dephospho-CoA kinase [Candidatus Hydrogenedentes bacterium]|nr:dephospho-CoA kinase [Candidatus Hydrogenedentota bacterium]
MIRIYGLTGGTGSGKTVAATRFEQHGICVIDADKAGHELLEPGGGAYQQVVEQFGPDVLTHGRVDRGKLGHLVFSDEAARKKLNAIVHPLIFQVISRRCAELSREGHRAVIIDAALLAENGVREKWLDGLILITAPRDVRVARLVAARLITPRQAQERIEAQSDPDKKRPLADWVVDNNGDLENFLATIDAIAGEIHA